MPTSSYRNPWDTIQEGDPRSVNEVEAEIHAAAMAGQRSNGVNFDNVSDSDKPYVQSNGFIPASKSNFELKRQNPNKPLPVMRRSGSAIETIV